ncbi:hypothetical protein [Mariniblastus fucicola]|uniref:Peptidase family M48 n=1 Tax=Mariniblastus fucicola TaxID=980251 RepID=A0A5B9P3R3_9BACT|nr:hypothetical protein [Mariniblastus fucicola]QEG21048.1 hypothetical protein MFFC18_09000 [Mariniblastus fucicola]
MSYARSRLLLGVTGVGSLVTISFAALLSGLPQRFMSGEEIYGVSEFLQLAIVTGMFILWLMPLDFLGGFLLPNMFQRSSQSFQSWFRKYVRAVASQGLLFLVFGSLIIFFSQIFGWLGGLMAISFAIAGCFFVRNRLLLNRQTDSESSSEKLVEAIGLIQSWQVFVPRTVVVEHGDIGFTGGIVGLGEDVKIVIPHAWLEFDTEQLATAIARRAAAIDSGSYSRGLMLAFAWNVGGFLLCSLLPGAGLTSVAGLVTTVCGFTLWSFLGLLILPTVSRNASLQIDRQLMQQGMPVQLIVNTASELDQLQDGEPERPRWIETIFHPVPSVASRERDQPVRGIAAWNVARTTLFFSWACLGFLSRSVHCNVGRPELWTMLPTD